MSSARQPAANLSSRKEVTSRHPSKSSLASRPETSIENLIRKIVVQASELEAAGKKNNDQKGQVIVDAEIDGVRCLLTRIEKPQTPPISFTPRESEIARLVAQGYPNKTIAAALDISPWTVCTHLRRIFAKLRVSSRAALVARSISAGVVTDLL